MMTSPSSEGFNAYRSKIATIASKRKEKFEALRTGSNSQPALGLSAFYPNTFDMTMKGSPRASTYDMTNTLDMSDTFKTRFDFRKDDEHMKDKENVNQVVSGLRKRLEELTSTQKQIVEMHGMLVEEVKANQILNRDSLTEVAATFGVSIAAAESARHRLEEQVIGRISAIERSANAAHDMAKEAQERNLLATEVEQLQQYLDNVRLDVLNVDSKHELTVANFARRTQGELAQIREYIATEIIELYRVVKEATYEVSESVVAAKLELEGHCAGIEDNAKAESQRVDALVDKLRGQMQENTEAHTSTVESCASLLKRQMLEQRAKLEAIIRDEHKWFENAVTEHKKAHEGLNVALNREITSRQQDRDNILDEMALESMQRGKDETAIITAIEGMMKQLNNQHGVEALRF